MWPHISAQSYTIQWPEFSTVCWHYWYTNVLWEAPSVVLFISGINLTDVAQQMEPTSRPLHAIRLYTPPPQHPPHSFTPFLLFIFAKLRFIIDHSFSCMVYLTSNCPLTYRFMLDKEEFVMFSAFLFLFCKIFILFFFFLGRGRKKLYMNIFLQNSTSVLILLYKLYSTA